jgi:hypothetical protein
MKGAKAPLVVGSDIWEVLDIKIIEGLEGEAYRCVMEVVEARRSVCRSYALLYYWEWFAIRNLIPCEYEVVLRHARQCVGHHLYENRQNVDYSAYAHPIRLIFSD